MASSSRVVSTFVSITSIFFWAADLHAHARLHPDKQLKPRSSSTGEKVAPCGTLGPTTDVSKRAVLRAGEDLMVEWQETINHLGFFRISFSPDGINGFTTNVLKDNIVDTQNTSIVGGAYHLYSATVKVPDTLCDSCSIQLIQVMQDNPSNPSNYYSCSDIRFVAADTVIPTASPSPSATATATASPTPKQRPKQPTGLKVSVTPAKAVETTNEKK